MAKNKGKLQPEEELITQDEVSFEEVEQGSTAGNGGQSFLQKYRNLLIVGGVGAVVLGIFLVLRMSGREKANLEAQVSMINTVLEYERDSFNTVVAGGANAMRMEQFVDDYGNTDAGNLARFYAGTSYLQLGNVEQGQTLLEEYSKSSSMLSAAAYAALGFAHEQKNEFEEAAEMYEKAANTPRENAFSTPYYLMQAARNYESAGKNAEALELYRSIKEKYPVSQEGTSVEKYIAKLSPEDE